MSKKQTRFATTSQVRLYPTPEQAQLLLAHAIDYISTVNVLVSAIDADMVDAKFSTKDFVAALPSAVKNQILRDARSVWNRSLEVGHIPVLKKPVVQWNNQNWHLKESKLIIPVFLNGKTQQMEIRCADVRLSGKAGLLRIQKKRDKWIADITMILPKVAPVESELVMGVDLGVKVPAVVHIPSKGSRFFGHGRQQRAKRRQFYSRRKSLQKGKCGRAVRKSKGKEARWMKDVNHKLSRQIVNHAHQQGVGVIKLEKLSGIRERTTRQSGGDKATQKKKAKARKNNRMIATWSFYQLATFITYKAARLGIRVEEVDPAYTSQECPACGARNKASDRRYTCSACSWRGHRDSVGAVNISRRTGLRGKSVGATGT